MLGKMRSSVVDTVFADPPFNLGKDYKNGFDDCSSKEQYIAWSRSWITQCSRVLKPGGSFFLYATPELAVQFAPMLAETLQFRHWIALTMKGTYPRGNKLYPAHYALLYYSKGLPATFNKLRLPIEVCRHCGKEIKDYGGHRGKMNPEGVNLTDFWTDTSPNRHKKFKVRPGVNELKLMIPERAVLISTKPSDLVLDPFGGGGTTFQAAEMHHRHWIGIEIYDSKHIATRMSETFPESFKKPQPFKLETLFKNEDNQSTVLRRGARKGLQAGAVAAIS